MSFLSYAVVAWALAAAAFTALTLWACARLGRAIARRRLPARWPSVWLLRPCEGLEPFLAENLASSFPPYPGAYHVVFLVPSPADPAWSIARRAAAGRADAEVVATEIREGANRKSLQLAFGLRLAAAATAPPEVIVQADSDVVLDEDSITALVAAMGDDPRVAASFAPPVEPYVTTFGDLAASGLLAGSHQSFYALAALADLSGGVASLAGPLCAHRRAELEASGGFDSLVHVLGEDFEVGRRLHERGYALGVSASPARTLDCGRPFLQVLARTMRWATVVKRQRGALIATYPLLLAPTPLLLLAGAVCATLGDAIPLAFAAVLLGARTLLALRLRRIHQAPVGALRALGLAFAAEVLMLAASARALTTSHVVWRGRRLRVLRGGVIEGARPW